MFRRLLPIYIYISFPRLVVVGFNEESVCSEDCKMWLANSIFLLFLSSIKRHHMLSPLAPRHNNLEIVQSKQLVKFYEFYWNCTTGKLLTPFREMPLYHLPPPSSSLSIITTISPRSKEIVGDAYVCAASALICRYGYSNFASASNLSKWILYKSTKHAKYLSLPFKVFF